MNASQEIMTKLLAIGVGLTNTSIKDAILTTNIFLEVVDKTMLDNASTSQLKPFLKVNVHFIMMSSYILTIYSAL